MISIKYSHLADYVGIGANGKPIIVGIYENVFAVEAEPSGYRVPLSYLVVALQGSIIDAGTHRAEIELVDGNRQPLKQGNFTFELELVPNGEGRPLVGLVVALLSNIFLPEVGDYEFVVRVNDAEIGTVQLALLPALQTGT